MDTGYIINYNISDAEILEIEENSNNIVYTSKTCCGQQYKIEDSKTDKLCIEDSDSQTTVKS